MNQVSPSQDLNWLLLDLLEKIPASRSAVLLSTDGLRKASQGLDQDAAEGLAALASTLCSVGGRIGAEYGDGPEVGQILLELQNLLVFVCTAGPGSVLVVLTENTADATVVGHEMTMLCNKVRSFLATAPRHAVSGPDHGGR